MVRMVHQYLELYMFYNLHIYIIIYNLYDMSSKCKYIPLYSVIWLLYDYPTDSFHLRSYHGFTKKPWPPHTETLVGGANSKEEGTKKLWKVPAFPVEPLNPTHLISICSPGMGENAKTYLKPLPATQIFFVLWVFLRWDLVWQDA